jgi:hypothetical protein
MKRPEKGIEQRFIQPKGLFYPSMGILPLFKQPGEPKESEGEIL